MLSKGMHAACRVLVVIPQGPTLFQAAGALKQHWGSTSHRTKLGIGHVNTLLTSLNKAFKACPQQVVRRGLTGCVGTLRRRGGGGFQVAARGLATRSPGSAREACSGAQAPAASPKAQACWTS